jgi:ATP-dependent Clp protease ATP-binding subunit ClpA
MESDHTFPVEMGFSPQAARVMKRAEQTAARFGQRVICSEHLLLALLEEDTGPAVQIADGFGDRDAMCAQLELVLSTPPTKGDNDTKRRLAEEWRRKSETA